MCRLESFLRDIVQRPICRSLVAYQLLRSGNSGPRGAAVYVQHVTGVHSLSDYRAFWAPQRKSPNEVGASDLCTRSGTCLLPPP